MQVATRRIEAKSTLVCINFQFIELHYTQQGTGSLSVKLGNTVFSWEQEPCGGVPTGRSTFGGPIIMESKHWLGLLVSNDSVIFYLPVSNNRTSYSHRTPGRPRELLETYRAI
jgi:hypothetical protein